MKVKLVLVFILYKVSCFGINPKKDYISTPKEYDIEYQEKIIKTDSAEICIWISQPKENLSNTQKSQLTLIKSPKVLINLALGQL